MNVFVCFVVVVWLCYVLVVVVCFVVLIVLLFVWELWFVLLCFGGFVLMFKVVLFVFVLFGVWWCNIYMM